MTIATINHFISLFNGAFEALSVKASMADVERMATRVHHSMESKARAYHTAGHVFGMCEGMNPQQVLAALFHDVVYYQLDNGFPPKTVDLLHAVTHLEDGDLVLNDIAPDDHALALCAAIFGFEPGQTLPLYGGMNEFLSAVVAARLLHPHLKAADLLTVVACIEATIPFRAAKPDGSTAADTLAQRVQAQGPRWLATLPQSAIAAHVAQVVLHAVQLSNRDVGGFAQLDPGLFLSSTWLLIEESNAPLAAVGVYSLQDYRMALMRMDTFLGGLRPATIFQSYAGHPGPLELEALLGAARRNIGFACDFLDAKIVSISIIEALALCTGTDGPISMFLGDIRSAYGKPDRVEDFLPEAPMGRLVNADLLQVFEKGRALESANDLTASPLTAFVYRFLGHEGTRHALALARQMFDGDLAPQVFLQALDRDMVRAIIEACAQIALSRSAALRALEAGL